MSNRQEFTRLMPAREEDIDEAVAFYNHEIKLIQGEMANAQAAGCPPSRITLWSPFTHDQVRNIIEDPHSELLIMRKIVQEELGEYVVGNIVGGVGVDRPVNETFPAWAPQEVGLLTPEPLHFAKFLADHTIKGLGRGALWSGLLDYAEKGNVTALYAEAWDFTHDGVPKDHLHKFYTDLGMEWHGTVTYRNDYYGNVIGQGRPVNRFMYDISLRRRIT